MSIEVEASTSRNQANGSLSGKRTVYRASTPSFSPGSRGRPPRRPGAGAAAAPGARRRPAAPTATAVPPSFSPSRRLIVIGKSFPRRDRAAPGLRQIVLPGPGAWGGESGPPRLDGGGRLHWSPGKALSRVGWWLAALAIAGAGGSREPAVQGTALTPPRPTTD